jgi:hypothetical protein
MMTKAPLAYRLPWANGPLMARKIDNTTSRSRPRFGIYPLTWAFS